MNAPALRAMAAHEVRLRMRRASTVFAMLAVIAVTWLAIPDPRGGMTLMHAGGARLLYDSMTLSIGSAVLLNLLFGLGGFYLVRGRVAEDLRCGIGGVLGATPVGDGTLLLGRWLGGMAYLCALAAAFMTTMLVLHGLRGEAPIQLSAYLQTYVLMLLPAISLAAGMAVLCESCGPLVGKAGDVLYFIVWATQFSSMAPTINHPFGGWNPLLLIDFNGAATVIARLIELFGTPDISIGLSDFNAAVPPAIIGSGFWTADMIATRCASALLGAVPLLPAMLLFHRFSPDRVKAAHGKKRGSPLDLINRVLRPLARLALPLLALAGRLPVPARGIVADLALTLMSKPSLIAALAVASLAGLLAQASALGGVVMMSVVFWGIAVSDVAVRNHAADLESMSGALAGGATAHALAQAASTLLLGCLLTAPALLRWMVEAPLRALALAGGLFFLSAVAHLLGRATRSARTFLALFLVAMYISAQAPNAAILDLVGAHGSATPFSVSVLSAAGLVAILLAWLFDRRARR
ncbi:MAG TPA: hypothetical protein VEC06_15590 [Paucimonas sp.]|nr:hypothetical protein [Paucimonas sp.]